MSAPWKGRLCNTAADVFIDTSLLVLCVIAYIPQVGRLRHGTSGISPYYILFNILLTNASLSELLVWHAFAWPNDLHPVIKQINNGSLTGLRAFGGILGLLQIFLQWACSVAVNGGRSIHVAILAFLHIAIVVLPAVSFSLPKPTHPGGWGQEVPMALIIMSDEKIAPISIVLQLFAQLWEMRKQSGNPGGLSLLSVGFQLLIFLALGFRWVIRLGKLPNDFKGHSIDYWTVSALYQWGFPAVNYIAQAVSCAILLACYLAVAGRPRGDLEEQQPLLR